MQARLLFPTTLLEPAARRVRLGLFFGMVLLIGMLVAAEIFPEIGVFPGTFGGLVGRVVSMTALAGLSLALGGVLLVVVGFCLDHLRRLRVVQAVFLTVVAHSLAPIPTPARAPTLRPPIFSL